MQRNGCGTGLGGWSSARLLVEWRIGPGELLTHVITSCFAKPKLFDAKAADV
jgi:hypothetical protein